jgi:amino acid adenylation domain-containing protein
VALGAAVSSRNRPELERLIGFFVNTLVLRNELSGDLTFRELTARIGADFLEDYAHADLPFEYLARKLGRSRDWTGSPLFNVAFALNPEPYDAIQRAAGAYAFEISPAPIRNQTAKLDLAFLIWQSNQELTIELEYSTDRFDAETIERLASCFMTLLTAVLENPEQPLREVPLLDAAQRKQLLHDWNATQHGPAHPATLHLRFEEQAAQHPADPAVEYEGRTLSYTELNRRANQLASHLMARGVGPVQIVGICLHRSLEMIAAVLAVWKSGAAYVPIDPSYPARRVAWMIEDCSPTLILAHPGIPGLANSSAEVLELDASWSAFADQDDSNPNFAAAPSDLAYVYYTSGSTGRPKGAMICHRNLANHCEGILQHRKYWDRRRVLMVMSLSFDAAVLHIAAALVTGGTLVLPGPAAMLPGPGMLELVQSARINFMAIPPSVLALLPAADVPSLETLAVGGEACPASLVERWAPGRTMLNLYGPTEATIWATLAVCETDGSPPPIGGPVANFRCYVLDDFRQPVPVGAPGELYLGGPSVGVGYLNRPELTAEKFIPDPFRSESGARLYRTGDRVRWRADGNLEFLGRIDHQVKVLGYRIELGEIEAALQEHPAVRQACVLAQPDAANNLQLHAYVAVSPDDKDWGPELRAWLRTRLPTSMLPARFTVLDQLPLSSHGKVDRAALEQIQVDPAPRTIPRDSDASDKATESRLIRIWKDVLNAEHVTVDDNFFALGGDSIMALQVASRARQEGIPLAPYDFFQHQTVAAQAAAAALAGDQGTLGLFTLDGLDAGLKALLPLRATGAKPPLFCVHHIAGLGLQYWDLARRLSPDQPVYAFQAAGLDGRSSPRSTVEEMAARYVEEARSIQPQGPYLLAGYSFGGIVAYEIAQQLAAGGSKVALLAIIDRPIPDSLLGQSDHAPPSLDAEWSIGVVRLVESLWGVRLASSAEDVRPLSVDELLERIVHAVRRDDRGDRGTAALRGAVEAAGEELLRNIFRVVEANAAAGRAYQPRPYPGRMTLFRAAERHAGMNHDYAAIHEDPYLGWARLSEHPIFVHSIPGDHFSMIAPPHVDVLAERLQEALDAAIDRKRG